MKVARLALAPLALTLCISQACSDPPSPPAQGAVTLKILPTPGFMCVHTNNNLSMPSAENAGVLEELACDLSTGCKPDEYLVVDRDRGANLSCTVSPNGGNFNVQVDFLVDGIATGTPSMHFSINGANVSPSGGVVTINETNSVAGGGGSDATCTLSIIPNFGVIKKGSIWARFECDNFLTPGDLQTTGCTVTGAFLFENCGG